MNKKGKLVLIILMIISIVLIFGLVWLQFDQTSKNKEFIIEKTEAIISIIVSTPVETPNNVGIVPEINTTETEKLIQTEFPIVKSSKTVQQNSHPTTKPRSLELQRKKTDYAFKLTILGTEVFVANGVEEATLEKTPGWLPISAKPGEEGICVIYGHRNRNHLQVLKRIKENDIIIVSMPNGKSYTYIVDSVEILEEGKTLQIPIQEGNILILTTCYPFYYNGHAPKKIVVTCIM